MTDAQIKELAKTYNALIAKGERESDAAAMVDGMMAAMIAENKAVREATRRLEQGIAESRRENDPARWSAWHMAKRVGVNDRTPWIEGPLSWVRWAGDRVQVWDMRANRLPSTITLDQAKRLYKTVRRATISEAATADRFIEDYWFK